ncbi:hypothetical protein M901_1803 [Bacteriovorax sp. DB6_IX]|nr:hypothetical protein M901_1803 [Bacteriovorax sp. DB6_IX]
MISPIKDGQISPQLAKVINWHQQTDYEFILVNSGNLLELKNNKIQVLQKETNSRAEKMNFAASATTAQFFVFIHPRSFLEKSAIEQLTRTINKKELQWGAFTHRFDKRNRLLDFTSWYSNNIRGKFSQIYYLDHCLFIKRELFENIQGFPNLSIFEDTAICEKLRKHSPAFLCKSFSTTSSVRFNKNGLLKQILLNQILKIAYHLGVNDERMNKIYERGLNLNSKY